MTTLLVLLNLGLLAYIFFGKQIRAVIGFIRNLCQSNPTADLSEMKQQLDRIEAKLDGVE